MTPSLANFLSSLISGGGLIFSISIILFLISQENRVTRV